MTRYFVFAIPLALFWMGITNLLTWESFLVGYLLGLGGTALFRPRLPDVRLRKLPGQLLALLLYVILLYRDILLSGIDLTRRVLSRDMKLKLGIVAVPIQDPQKSQLIAALSADVVTLTPGELVIEIEDNSIMHVHSLDSEKTEAHATEVQAQRLHLLKRILGREQ